MSYTFEFSDQMGANGELEGVPFDNLQSAIISAANALAEIALDRELIESSQMSVTIKEWGVPRARVNLALRVERLDPRP